MIWLILILAASAGVFVALGQIMEDYKRRRKAKKDWDEFNRTKDIR